MKPTTWHRTFQQLGGLGDDNICQGATKFVSGLLQLWEQLEHPEIPIRGCLVIHDLAKVEYALMAMDDPELNEALQYGDDGVLFPSQSGSPGWCVYLPRSDRQSTRVSLN
jgi:hypothetical protein